MAVTSSHYSRDTGATAQFNERNLGTYRVTWEVQTNALMSPRAVANGAQSATPNPLPALWATYSYQSSTDTSSFLKNIDVHLKDSRSSQYLWIITGTYSPLTPGQTVAAGNTTPTSRPVVWNWEREVYMEVLDADINGDPILNSAGQPFDDVIEQERTRSVLVATINVANLSTVIGYAATYSDHINGAAWQGLAKHQVLCREVTSTPIQTEGANSFYAVTFRFAIAPDGETWNKKFLHRGFSELKDISGTPILDDDGEPVLDENDDPTFHPSGTFGLVRIVGKDKQPLSEPALLDANGKQLPVGGTPVYTAEIQTRPEANFSLLPF